jgi:hypothetical protein
MECAICAAINAKINVLKNASNLQAMKVAAKIVMGVVAVVRTNARVIAVLTKPVAK